MPSFLEFQPYHLTLFGAHHMVFLAIFLTLAFTLAYIFLVRPILVHSVVLSPVFKQEAALVDQLRAKLAGWKTKLMARFVMLAGFMVYSYDIVAPIVMGQDWTPITAKLPSWAVPVGMVVIGYVFSLLRKVTENPPQVITQKMEDGSVQVVALNKPGA